jgi:hypothetical protein
VSHGKHGGPYSRGRPEGRTPEAARKGWQTRRDNQAAKIGRPSEGPPDETDEERKERYKRNTKLRNMARRRDELGRRAQKLLLLLRLSGDL